VGEGRGRGRGREIGNSGFGSVAVGSCGCEYGGEVGPVEVVCEII